MGQGTMLLSEAAEISGRTVEEMAREAYDGRLTVHALPACPACKAPDAKPCEPTCEHAGTQVVWIGDWFHWQRGGNAA
jgi:hypothetical protein